MNKTNFIKLLISIYPNFEKEAEHNIKLVDICTNAALYCFVNETFESEATEALRYQLKQLGTFGVFNFKE